MLSSLSLRTAALAACLALALAGLGARAAKAHAYSFAHDSAWDAPLSPTAATTPDSAALVAELNRQVASSGTWINTTTYSTPVYTVPAGQPTVAFKLDTSYSPLQNELLAVPIPPGAAPARGSDAHLVVRQPATDTIWEFWHAQLQPDGWHARWGGKMSSASTNPGYFVAPYGATATSLPLLGGLMTPDELAAGRIDHALALAIPAAGSGQPVWPAQRTDGVATTSPAIPEGTRFRVDPSLNVDAMKASAAVKAMVRAAQRYGIIVRDQAGTVAFFAEDPTPWGTNPYPAIFGTRWLDQYNALKPFPWDRLQVVAPDRTAFAAKVTTAPAKPGPAVTVTVGRPASGGRSPAPTATLTHSPAAPEPAAAKTIKKPSKRACSSRRARGRSHAARCARAARAKARARRLCRDGKHTKTARKRCARATARARAARKRASRG